MPDEPLPPLVDIAPGYYRHYKGRFYRVLATVRHSETRESMTLYQALYGERGLWVRPSAMFGEEIVHAGKRQPRFAPVPAPAVDAAQPGLPQIGWPGI